MEALYSDVYGNPLNRNEWDKHHVHARSTARGKSCEVRRFINRRGLLLPLVKTEHVKITRELPKPPLPSVSLMYRVNMHADQLPEMNVYDTFLAISEFMHDVSERCPNSDHRKQAGQIAENYELQTPMILAGQVILTPLEEAA